MSSQAFQSESVLRFDDRRTQPSDGDVARTERAELIPLLPMEQSEGISPSAKVTARLMAAVSNELREAETIRRLTERLQGLVDHPRGNEASFDELSRVGRRLRDLLSAYPVEDGVCHPGEAELMKALCIYPHQMSDWISARVRGGQSEGVAVLKLIGRLPRSQVDSGLYDLAAGALESDELELRDAAAKALELWRGERAREILEKHREPTPWLADYLARLVEELKSEH